LPSYRHCHTFAAARGAVSVLKFAPRSAELVAWGGADGAVYVATLQTPARLVQVWLSNSCAACSASVVTSAR
jgi:hypothetical protein